MKQVAIIFLLVSPCVASIVGVVYLLATGVQEGWGWLVFIALATSSVKYKLGGDDE